MKQHEGVVTLESTGRTFQTFGSLSLSPLGDVRYGYDGSVGETEELSEAEKVEIADYMIQQWTAFRALHAK